MSLGDMEIIAMLVGQARARFVQGMHGVVARVAGMLGG